MIRATQAQTAHFLLRKNYLAAASPALVPQLFAGIAGLPAALNLSPFLAAFNRLPGFRPAHLLAELHEKRHLIHSILIRSTDTIIPASDYIVWRAATARQHKQVFNSQFRLWGLDNGEVETLGRAILEVIGRGPATPQVIVRRLPGALVKSLSQTSRGGRVTATSNVALVLRWLVARGDLAIGSASPAGGDNWRVQTPAYAPLVARYPLLEPAATPPEAEAQASLVRAYLAAYGPASEADISAWTGFGKSETARAISALAAATTLVMVEGLPGMMLLLKEQAETLAATPPLPEALVHILPSNDPFVTAHRASRARLLANPRQQRHVFRSSGAVRPVILLNGQVVGVWRWTISHGHDKITWQLFEEPGPAKRSLVRAEVDHLAAFLGPQTAVEETEGDG